MTEVYLFVAVGTIAVIAAMMMLISENAVHSALFLILNFACVAFMYLMLDAPFLAMVQIAVYAGAIMVLFLFVIMLLGAESSESRLSSMKAVPGSRLHTPVAVLLTMILLLTVGIAIAQENVDFIEDDGAEPLVRVANYTYFAPRLNVLLDATLTVEGLQFGKSSEHLRLTAGEHTLTLVDAETGAIVLESTLTLEADQTVSALVTGIDEATLTTFAEDLTQLADNQTRVSVFNATGEAVSLQDTGSPFGSKDDSRLVVADVPANSISAPIVVNSGESDSLRFIAAENGALGEDAASLFNIVEAEFVRDTHHLIVLTDQPNASEPFAYYLATDTAQQFGSPKAVGQILFTKYLLPLQVVGLVLLAALVGVIVLSQRQVSTVEVRARRPERRRVSRPLTSVIANQVEDSTGASGGRLQAGEKPAGD